MNKYNDLEKRIIQETDDFDSKVKSIQEEVKKEVINILNKHNLSVVCVEKSDINIDIWLQDHIYHDYVTKIVKDIKYDDIDIMYVNDDMDEENQISFKNIEFTEAYDILDYLDNMPSYIDLFNEAINQDSDVSFLELIDRIEDEDWKIDADIYHLDKIAKTYQFQKKYLDTYPENITKLKKYGYNKKLVENPDYAWMFEQESSGFFNIKNEK